MVSTRSLISKSSSPNTNHLVTVLVIIGITVNFMFHSFFSYLLRSRYLSLCSLSFGFTQWSTGTVKSIIWQILFSLLTITRFGRLAEIRWSICISKYLRSLFISFSWTYSVLCIYNVFAWPNLYFLHNSQSITNHTQSCLVLSYLCSLTAFVNYVIDHFISITT